MTLHQVQKKTVKGKAKGPTSHWKVSPFYSQGCLIYLLPEAKGHKINKHVGYLSTSMV